MQLTDRLTQLASFGVSVVSRPLQVDEFQGPIVHRYDDGEGVEFIDIKDRYSRIDFRRGDKTWNLLVAEFGLKRAEELAGDIILAGGVSTVHAQKHVLLDGKGKREYEFLLPHVDYHNGGRPDIR